MTPVANVYTTISLPFSDIIQGFHESKQRFVNGVRYIGTSIIGADNFIRVFRFSLKCRYV